MATILWEGQSLLDNETPIRVYGTGDQRPSANAKTGAVLQTWILLAHTSPTEAVRQGTDAAICGECIHRQTPRSCYVNVGRAPRSIFHSDAQLLSRPLNSWATGQTVRLGAYGDPAAVPFGFWQLLLDQAEGWLGYTHQWTSCDQRLKRFCMASVDSRDEYDRAHDMGWRCFWADQSLDCMPDDERITLCPASTEAGKRLTCDQCMSCSGLGNSNRTGDVFIPIHGAAYMRLNFARKAA